MCKGGEKRERRQGDSWEAKAEGLPEAEGGGSSGRAGLSASAEARAGEGKPRGSEPRGHGVRPSPCSATPQLCDREHLPAPTSQCRCPGCENGRQTLSSEGHVTRKDFRPDKWLVLLSLACLLLSQQGALCWGWGQRSHPTSRLAGPGEGGAPLPHLHPHPPRQLHKCLQWPCEG